ncbi:YafY family transcriptional regulator [Verrucomicrobia bacterium LW23]|nr:YafY family transcriptional regulator [Verrucomicrobia bacterium LW23]
MNRMDRLVGLILLLQGKRVITAEEMAAHFEISLRTIYRDLAALSEAGVPIAAEAGVGYSLMRGYHVPPVMFTEEEAAALYISGEIAERLADASLRASLKSAMLKISSILPANRREYVSRLRRAVSVWPLMAPTAPPADEDDAPPPEQRAAFMPLQDAVVRRKCVALRYNAAGRGDISQRIVEPLGLVFYSRQWHLIAHCRMRRDFRDFRLDRVAAWEVLEETYDGHESFSLNDFLRESIDRHELYPAVLHVCPGLVDRLLAAAPGAFGGAGPTPRTQRLPDGRIRLEILLFSIRWTATWLLGFGTGVQAVEPPELVAAVQDAARQTLSLYAPPAPPPAEAAPRDRKISTPATAADIGLSVDRDVMAADSKSERKRPPARRPAKPPTAGTTRLHSPQHIHHQALTSSPT